MEIFTMRLANIAITSTLGLTLAVMLFLKLFYVYWHGVNEDVDMILTPARTLVTECSLANAGGAYPMQVIRDSSGDSPDIEFPFYANYLGPVLYFAPFVAVLGAGTSAPFAAGQAIAIFAFVGLVLWLYRKRNRLRDNIALVLMMLATSLDGSLALSPTQMPFYVFLLVGWFYRDCYLSRPWFIGLIVGAAFQFRPEALALLTNRP
jgi:hypothetical protein